MFTVIILYQSLIFFWLMNKIFYNENFLNLLKPFVLYIYLQRGGEYNASVKIKINQILFYPAIRIVNVLVKVMIVNNNNIKNKLFLIKYCKKSEKYILSIHQILYDIILWGLILHLFTLKINNAFLVRNIRSNKMV